MILKYKIHYKFYCVVYSLIIYIYIYYILIDVWAACDICDVF
jgi:hypothetical protein